MDCLMQPNVKPQPEEDGADTASSPSVATTGVSNVQVVAQQNSSEMHNRDTISPACNVHPPA